MKDCIFCKIISGEIPSKKAYDDKNVYAFEDAHPQAPIHVLIVPKKHMDTLLELSEEHREIISSIFLAANHIARTRGIAEKGFRIVTNCNEHGGQVVLHVHFHLLGGRKMEWPPG